MHPNTLCLVLSTLFATCQAASWLSFPRATPNCTSAQISNMDVGDCLCQPDNHACESTCESCGGIPALTKKKKVKDCKAGCTESEWSCEGCGIFFHTLCNCLQHPKNCPSSRKIRKGGRPAWVHLIPNSTDSDELITTTELLPGILEMSKNSREHDEGWNFAQQVWGMDQALAINPYRVRTHEQVHIHICKRNVGLYNHLSMVNREIYLVGGFHPLVGDPTTFCMTALPGQTFQEFATNIAFFLSQTTACHDLVGAAMMKDKQRYTWACVTTDSAGPLGMFC